MTGIKNKVTTLVILIAMLGTLIINRNTGLINASTKGTIIVNLSYIENSTYKSLSKTVERELVEGTYTAAQIVTMLEGEAPAEYELANGRLYIPDKYYPLSKDKSTGGAAGFYLNAGQLKSVRLHFEITDGDEDGKVGDTGSASLAFEEDNIVIDYNHTGTTDATVVLTGIDPELAKTVQFEVTNLDGEEPGEGVVNDTGVTVKIKPDGNQDISITGITNNEVTIKLSNTTEPGKNSMTLLKATIPLSAEADIDNDIDDSIADAYAIVAVRGKPSYKVRAVGKTYYTGNIINNAPNNMLIITGNNGNVINSRIRSYYYGNMETSLFDSTDIDPNKWAKDTQYTESSGFNETVISHNVNIHATNFGINERKIRLEALATDPKDTEKLKYRPIKGIVDDVTGLAEMDVTLLRNPLNSIIDVSIEVPTTSHEDLQVKLEPALKLNAHDGGTYESELNEYLTTYGVDLLKPKIYISNNSELVYGNLKEANGAYELTNTGSNTYKYANNAGIKDIDKSSSRDNITLYFVYDGKQGTRTVTPYIHKQQLNDRTMYIDILNEDNGLVVSNGIKHLISVGTSQYNILLNNDVIEDKTKFEELETLNGKLESVTINTGTSSYMHPNTDGTQTYRDYDWYTELYLDVRRGKVTEVDFYNTLMENPNKEYYKVDNYGQALKVTGDPGSGIQTSTSLPIYRETDSHIVAYQFTDKYNNKAYKSATVNIVNSKDNAEAFGIDDRSRVKLTKGFIYREDKGILQRTSVNQVSDQGQGNNINWRPFNIYEKQAGTINIWNDTEIETFNFNTLKPISHSAADVTISKITDLEPWGLSFVALDRAGNIIEHNKETGSYTTGGIVGSSAYGGSFSNLSSMRGNLITTNVTGVPDVASHIGFTKIRENNWSMQHAEIPQIAVGEGGKPTEPIINPKGIVGTGQHVYVAYNSIPGNIGKIRVLTIK